jgi:hypothetical protein
MTYDTTLFGRVKYYCEHIGLFICSVLGMNLNYECVGEGLTALNRYVVSHNEVEMCLDLRSSLLLLMSADVFYGYGLFTFIPYS